VDPRSIPDYLALVGDSADGFPGLPGWGAKSAATVLARYEHLSAIPDDVREWDVAVRGAAKLAATLAAARDAAELFLDLATLRTDADVGVVDDWEWRGATDELPRWAERLGSANLVPRTERLARQRFG
jgi:5'-3' exonuclease